MTARDPQDVLEPGDARRLLDYFLAAGDRHDDFETLDDAFEDEE